MKLTKTHRLILYALGQFYQQLNQPLKEKPLQLRTSKIAFVTFILHSGIVTKQGRALYKNLETLEKKNLITYDKRMIVFDCASLSRNLLIALAIAIPIAVPSCSLSIISI